MQPATGKRSNPMDYPGLTGRRKEDNVCPRQIDNETTSKATSDSPEARPTNQPTNVR